MELPDQDNGKFEDGPKKAEETFPLRVLVQPANQQGDSYQLAVAHLTVRA